MVNKFMIIKIIFTNEMCLGKCIKAWLKYTNFHESLSSERIKKAINNNSDILILL